MFFDKINGFHFNQKNMLSYQKIKNSIKFLLNGNQTGEYRKSNSKF